MVISITNLTADAIDSVTNGISTTTASITPSANKLIIVAVANYASTGTLITPTITGCSMTWTQIGTYVEGANNARRITLFRGVSSSPSSGSLTITYGQSGADNNVAWSVEEVDGVDTGGTNGSNAIVQSAGNYNSGTTTSLSVTLSAFSNNNNATYGFIRKNTRTTITAGSGFTELSNKLPGTTNLHIQAQYKATNDTSVDWTWGSETAVSVAMAIELKQLATSESASISLSPSASPSPSASQSRSSSLSPSASQSRSPSASPSPSASISLSPSASPSPSASQSRSPSASPSPSASQSRSPSVSPSASPSPSSSPSPAINGYSLDLEASSTQHVAIADADQTGLDLSSTFTIEAWIKIESLNISSATVTSIVGKYNSSNGKRSYMFCFRGDGTNATLNLYYSGDGANFMRYDSTRTFGSGDYGKWMHVAGTINASTEAAALYLNGIPLALTKVTDSNQSSIYNSDAAFMIGNTETTGNNFDGLIDDVRVWNIVRTETQIRESIFEDVSGQSGLVGYWKFDNDYTDSSGNGNTLTPTNNPVFSTEEAFPNYRKLLPIELGSTSLASDADLLSYYKLSSGALTTDEKSNNTLTNNNTVAEGTGKFDGGADQGATNTTNKSLAKVGSPGYSSGSDFAFSIIGWFNANSVASTIQFGNFAVNQRTFTRLDWYVTDGVFRFYRVNETTQQGATFKLTPSTGVWYHYALTYDGTTVKGYINGILFGSGSASGARTTTETSGIGIGIDGQNFGTLSAGARAIHDDVAFFKRALTYQEVFDLYTGTVGQSPSSSISLSPSPSEVDGNNDVLLQENYSGLLQEDGTSFILLESSQVPSASASISLSPSNSTSLSPSSSFSLSPSSSISSSPSPSSSISLSNSASISLSPSSSLSSSPSASISFSPSSSQSASISLSDSASQSLSPSSSISSSPSPSSSISTSISSSFSLSPSNSISSSISLSTSLSQSSSISLSNSLSPSSSESASPSIISSASASPSASESLSPSSSPSPSSSISLSSSLSPSASGSFSISLSESASPSPSSSISSSISASISQSPSASISLSDSASISLSPSSSSSLSPSSSLSLSPSSSISLSPSSSSSLSPSASSSLSPSASISLSPSSSLSLSPSSSDSASISLSPSSSISQSPSSSISASISLSPSSSISLSPSSSISSSISLSPSSSISLSPSSSVSSSISSSISASISLSPSSSVSASPSPAIYVNKYDRKYTIFTTQYNIKNSSYNEKYDKKIITDNDYSDKYKKW